MINKSTKKLLGTVGFFFYWALQIPAIVKEPSVILTLTPVNAGFILGLFGLKKVGNKHESTNER